MCEYCDEKEKVLLEYDQHFLFIRNNKLVFQDAHEIFEEINLDANYCLKCGRKLR